MPFAIMAGVSYSDYWKMTIGEIKRVVMRYSERSSTEAETKLKLAAFTAYNTACCVRTRTLPSSIEHTFPTLFGRTAEGGIKAENWQEGKQAMERIAQMYNSRGKVVTE